MARSDKEKKEIYDKWKKLINMSQEALNEWAKNPSRLEASLNRDKAKEEGGIQSGLDSLHRIKRRKTKPFKEWSDADFDNAAQENGFNGRMLGGKIGQPVGSTGMSKWEISLRNWGHDPSLSSSPANSKYKAWKKSNKDAIAKSKAKKNASVRVAYRFLMAKDKKPEPTKPKLWDKMIQMAKGELKSVTEGGTTINAPNDGAGFNKYPSAYANGWALAMYDKLGGGWK
jgi:hypothetical protein